MSYFIIKIYIKFYINLIKSYIKINNKKIKNCSNNNIEKLIYLITTLKKRYAPFYYYSNQI